MPFKNKMQRTAEYVLGQFNGLRDEESNLKVRLADTQEKKAQLEAAVARAQSLLKGNVDLPQNPCINCYVFHERFSSMTPIPDVNGVNMFRCQTCGDELHIAI